MDKIGIKLADGKFYPVLEDGSVARKRLVVTTVKDNQRSVQIDLYRGSGETVVGAEYIGSLVVEGIPAKVGGEPDISVDLGLSADGTLSAYAEEGSTHTSQSLKVSLKELSEEQKYEIPDFEVGSSGSNEAFSVFSDEDFGATDELPAEDEAVRLLIDEEPPPEEEPRRTRRPALLLVLIIAVLCLGLAYLIYRLSSGAGSAQAGQAVAPTAPIAQTVQPPAVQPAPAPAAAPPRSAAQPAAEAARPPAPRPKPAAAAPSGKRPGMNYRIKWGDTLWNLSYAFYRNPWYFAKIARVNKIRNPDFIIAGRTIWIPPR